MELTIKLSKEESGELGEAMGILQFFTEEAEKGTLLEWIARNGLETYLEKVGLAYMTFAKHGPYIELLIHTMKEEGLL
jgi:hypothetical protein